MFESSRYHPDLLPCIEQFAEFMLNTEADVICGVKRRSHSAGRLNFRAGYHIRMLKLQVGTVHVRVPNLRYQHLRPSMSKRFKRLEPLMVGTLDHTLRFGCELARIAALVAELWTLEITPQSHAGLVADVMAFFSQFQRAAILREAMALYTRKHGANPETDVAVSNGSLHPAGESSAPPVPITRAPSRPDAFAYSVY